MNKEIVVPSKEEIEMLLSFIINDSGIHIQTIGELLGMKLIDSKLPKFRGEPEWGYNELKEFFAIHKIDANDTVEQALYKLK